MFPGRQSGESGGEPQPNVCEQIIGSKLLGYIISAPKSWGSFSKPQVGDSVFLGD